MIRGWKAETFVDDQELAGWLRGKGRRFLVMILYQGETGVLAAENYILSGREKVRVMCNDPWVRERVAASAKEMGGMDAVCFVSPPPTEIEDFMAVRRGTGPKEVPSLELWWVYDSKKIDPA
jgi:hypothetical protein